MFIRILLKNHWSIYLSFICIIYQKKEREREKENVYKDVQSGVRKRKKEKRRGRGYVNVRSDRRRRRGYISLATVGWEGYIRPGKKGDIA